MNRSDQDEARSAYGAAGADPIRSASGEDRAAPPWTVIIHLWLLAAWRRRYLAAALMLAFPLLGLVVGISQSKIYTSRMTILIQESAKHNPFLNDLAVETRLKDRISALEALLHSRHILLDVATDRGLIDEATPAREREVLLRRLSSQLSLRLIGEEIVELSLKRESAEEIDKILLAVAQRFMEKVLAPERSSIVGSVRFLEEQLEKSARELIEADKAYAEFTAANADALPALHSGNVKRLGELQAALSERKTELDGASERYRNIVQRLALSNPVILRIEQQIIDQKTELTALTARYTDEHSAVQAARRRLSRLEAERNALLAQPVEADLSSIEKIYAAAIQKSDTDTDFGSLLISQLERLQQAQEAIIALRREVAALQDEIESVETRVARFGRMETELNRIERNLAVKRRVHEKLMERSEMARVTGALGQFEAPERIKVIDQPTAPSRPEGMPPLVFVAAGGFSGVAASLGAIVVLNFLDTTVKRRDEVETLTGAPVLARVPAMRAFEIDAAAAPRDGFIRRARKGWRAIAGRIGKPSTGEIL